MTGAEAIAERRDSERLYQTSQRILLFDRVTDPGQLLPPLIQEVFGLEGVALFDSESATTYQTGRAAPELEQRVRNAYVADSTAFDAATRTWFCVLHLDRWPVGALALAGGEISPLIATGLASLCAVALERYRSLQRELKAEAGRQSEQLRAAVLDALGHGGNRNGAAYAAPADYDGAGLDVREPGSQGDGGYAGADRRPRPDSQQR